MACEKLLNVIVLVLLLIMLCDKIVRGKSEEGEGATDEKKGTLLPQHNTFEKFYVTK